MEKERFVKTTCKICRKECGMIAHVKDGRIKSLLGDPDDLLNKGALCAKGAAALEFEYDANRLMYPMKRTGRRGEGKWERITWEEGLKYTAGRLKDIREKYGPGAISVHAGCEADNSFNLDRRFCDAAEFPDFSSGWGVCYGAQAAAFGYTFGTLTEIVDRFDVYKNSKLFIFWNSKVPHSSPAWLGVPDAMFSNKVKTIVIDPMFTPIASKADMWVPIRINSDLALALAMIQVIIKEELYDKEFVQEWTVGFDELRSHVGKYTPVWAEESTDVPARKIEEIARIYANSKPATLCFNLSCHHTQYFQFARAFSILMAITGNIDREGGARVLRPRKPIIDRGMHSFADTRLGLHGKRPPITVGSEFPATYNVFKKVMILDSPWQERFLYKGRIKAIICDAINLLIRKPNYHKTLESIKGLELLVVYDVYMSETAKYADIIFPSTTFLERDGISLRDWHKGGRIRARQKVVEPPGECRSNFDFFKGLAEEMGIGNYFSWKDVRQMIDYILEPTGRTFDELQRVGFIELGEPLEEKAYEKHGFPTPSGKVELYSAQLEKMGVSPLPVWRDELFFKPNSEFPLILSSFTPARQHSWTLWPSVLELEEVLEEDCAYVHQDVAKEIGIREKDWIRITTMHGNARYKAKVTEFIHPDSVIVSRGLPQQAKLIDLCDPIDPDSAFMAERGMLCRISKSE